MTNNDYVKRLENVIKQMLTPLKDICYRSYDREKSPFSGR